MSPDWHVVIHALLCCMTGQPVLPLKHTLGACWPPQHTDSPLVQCPRRGDCENNKTILWLHRAGWIWTGNIWRW